MSDNAGTQRNMRVDLETCRDPDLLAAEVRRLRAVIAAGDCPDPDNAAKPDRLTVAEREAVAASREFWAAEAGCELRDETDKRYADTLSGLLERMGGGA
jgi:hypothetical protein